jgi:hypothetical protein
MLAQFGQRQNKLLAVLPELGRQKQIIILKIFLWKDNEFVLVRIQLS